MDIKNNICFYFWRIPERFFKNHNISAFVATKYGIKNLNMGCLTNYERALCGDVVELSPDSLYLGPDFLKDNFTLLNCRLLDSPHYSFIDAVNNGANPLNSDYYYRYIKGTLDWRHCQLRSKDPKRFFEKNEKSKKEIEKGEYKPVVVYYWKNRCYIFDGKHRAALCAFMNIPIRCLVVPATVALDGVWARLFHIVKNSGAYSLHNGFITCHEDENFYFFKSNEGDRWDNPVNS